MNGANGTNGTYRERERDATQRRVNSQMPTENEEPTAAENIILQCFASGVLIVFVLLISMSSSAPTVRLREILRETLTGAETASELIGEVRFLGEEYFGWNPAIVTESISFSPSGSQAGSQSGNQTEIFFREGLQQNENLFQYNNLQQNENLMQHEIFF
jgi:hypothetical protein